MEWIAENWFVILLGVGMVAMHFFGHGHGGHSGHGRKKPLQGTPKDADTKADKTRQ